MAPLLTIFVIPWLARLRKQAHEESEMLKDLHDQVTKKLAPTMEHMAAKQDQMGHQVIALETKVSVFWDGVLGASANALHRPHPQHARRDYLLESVLDNSLTPEEASELRDRLREILDDHSSSTGDKFSAAVIEHHITGPDPEAAPEREAQ